jgi:protein-L-isoaspartate(D-aspartate) O-methyltransferase
MSGKRSGARFPLQLQQVKPAPAAPVRTGAAAPRELLRPQRPLQQAAQDAQRQAAPSGLGMDSSAVRSRMVQRLAAQGVRHEALLQAFSATPRHQFVDSALVQQAYEDTSLPIGHGQTISKPSVVARMIELLLEGANARARGQLGRMLEIGTGCGYQAALLAQLGSSLVSVERLQPLFDKARENLKPLHLRNVRLVFGDGMIGHAPNAPYDSIIAAAGGEQLPQAWLDQLAVGGRLVAPVHAAPSQGQVLVVVDRHAQGYSRQIHEGVLFVPLKSGIE